MINRLKSPIPLPTEAFDNTLVSKEISRLMERREAYNRIASITLTSQWPSIKTALEEVINQYTRTLVDATDVNVTRCQEAIKAYRFLADMPNTAQENIVEIDRAIQSLGGPFGVSGHIDADGDTRKERG